MVFIVFFNCDLIVGETMLSTLLEGCLIGFSIAMPVGPIGLLCIRNSLSRGIGYGFATGLGAALADTIFGAIGALGVTYITSLTDSYQWFFELSGGVFLCYIGLAVFMEKVQEAAQIQQRKSYWGAFLSTFFLTMTNPLTILSFAAVYATLGISLETGDFFSPFFMVLGVFLGSTFWWGILSAASAQLSSLFDAAKKKYLNRISGSVIFSLGTIAFLKSIGTLLKII